MTTCDACDHFGYAEGALGDKPLRHSSVFTESETSATFCIEHCSAYISWLLDGGMLTDPELYAWVGAQPGSKTSR